MSDLPRKWSIHEEGAEDEPVMFGTVLVDGQEVPYVQEYDMDEGYVYALCTDGHTGHPGKPHLYPPDGKPCALWIRGKVEVRVKATP